jgi:hypothetical protein
MTGFSGSYDPRDVEFLLKRVQMAPTPTVEKERLIQSGRRHYSEMIGEERPPDPGYLALYDAALARNASRLAEDVARLARLVAEVVPAPPVLLSLARAGTPIGVLLRRALAALGLEARHYSISIIRDLGLDARALDHVLARHPPESVLFVDGWTGKGAIARELERYVPIYARERGIALAPSLAVVSDLAGVSTLAASSEDYLLPPAILNSVVSGLISRTVLSDAHVGPGDFHGVVLHEELAPWDRSRDFVDQLSPLVEAALPHVRQVPIDRAALRETSQRFVERCLREWNMGDPHRVKPGIGEATRALLRRVPEHLLLRQDDDEVRHLRWLAARAGVPVTIDTDLPYRAAVIIRTLGKDA